jgi:hypothetical protein
MVARMVGAPWHFTTVLDLFDHWQTLVAGLVAIVAAVLTIWATLRSTSREIAASQKQIDTTLLLERRRIASEDYAFHAMLEAAMERVLAEAAWARRTYPGVFRQTQGATADAFVVRANVITKGAFAELRAACVRQGGRLTGEFLDLEREIDSFASQCEEQPSQSVPRTITVGKHLGLADQLASIEAKQLRDEAAAAKRGAMHMLVGEPE